jgi:hypothetical protein
MRVLNEHPNALEVGVGDIYREVPYLEDSHLTHLGNILTHRR